MISLRADQLAAITNGTLYNSGAAASCIHGISIDSRTLAPGQLFAAIRGEATDGHAFIDAAVQKGATAVMVRSTYERLHLIPQQVAVVTVVDTTLAFRNLAVWYRDQVAPNRLGISGSNGKTTTKEMAASLLAAVEPDSFASPGNLNNLFGVPLTYFAMPVTTKALALELGVSQPGEMSELIPLARPHAAVITNVAVSHLEHLGSLDGVLAEELDLLRAVAPGPVIVAESLGTVARKIRPDVLTFGPDATADIHPGRVDTDARQRTRVTIDGHQFVFELFGKHQVLNLLAAYGGVRALGYSFDGIDTAAIRFRTAPLRGEIVRIGDWTIIADCYNANPASMESGLSTFATMKGSRRVAILGDMLELGADEQRFHEELGKFAATLGLDLLVTVGPLAASIASSARAAGMPGSSVRSLPGIGSGHDIIPLLQSGDTIYLKGSRGAALERLIPKLQQSQVAA